MAPLPRVTLQQLAIAKIEDARLLFTHGIMTWLKQYW